MNRRLLFTLLAGYIAFTLYNTLIPFQLRPAGPPTIAAAVHQVFHTRHPQISLTDVVGNVILFIPMGLLCGLLGRRLPAVAVLPAAVLLAFVLSTSIEVLQICFDQRIASRADIVNNTAGAFLGAAAVFLVPPCLARRGVDRAGSLMRSDPWTAALLVFLTVAVLRAWFPFDVGISVSEVKNALKNAVVTPFGTIRLRSWLAGGQATFSQAPFDGFAFFADLWFWAFWG